MSWKKYVLEKRNCNSMANENCKNEGFFFSLHYFGPCIAGKILLNIIIDNARNNLITYLESMFNIVF